MSEQKKLCLVGFANSGKTTLNNKLTGQSKTTGNWTGVTVGTSTAQFCYQEQQFELTDLPGLSNLATRSATSKDVGITQSFLLEQSIDCIINVVDASQLSRQLVLTTQLCELGIPLVLVLTKLDRSTRRDIDIELLSETFDCPVLCSSLDNPLTIERAAVAVSLAKPTTSFVGINSKSKEQNTPSGLLAIAENQCETKEDCDCNAELVSIMQRRHQLVRGITNKVVKREANPDRLSNQLDNLLLHPITGVPLFLLAMYLLFMFAINVGSAFIDFFDILAGGLFVNLPLLLVSSSNFPAWLLTIIEGVGLGAQTVATFVPVIICLFIGLSILESSGYLARAAFVVDSLMQKIGLPGKAFVPLIVGFGCTVPAVMSTRVLDSERERITTVMMSPFMSCGARLPVYALFAAAFFPNSGQNLVFLLYLVGILAAIGTGLLLKKTVLPGRSSEHIMELPSYEIPNVWQLAKRVAQRTKSFILGAGQTIVVVVCVLNFFNSLGIDGEFGHRDSDRSVLSAGAQIITPALAPMGIKNDNWQAGVGIITGIFAKEALVATFNSLYSPSNEGTSAEVSLASIWQQAVASVPFNLAEISASDPLGVDVGEISTLTLAAEAQEVELTTYQAMQNAFEGQIGAFSYLLFILLYTPCAAAMGAIKNEVGKAWAGFAAIWSFSLAYIVATVCFQLGQLTVNPVSSFITIALCLTALFGIYKWLKHKSQKILSIAVAVSYR